MQTDASGTRRNRPAPSRDHGTRSLVLIGGLPGAGKTMLLSALLGSSPPGVVTVDSEQVAARLRAAGIGLPYRLLRPLVHLWHRLRVGRAIRGPTPVVVVTDPMTSPHRRTALLRAAARAGRAVRLVLVEATPEEAFGGQLTRGRALTSRAMRRHTRRWADLLAAARSADGVPGIPDTVVVRRAEAGRLGLRDLLGQGAEGLGRGAPAERLTAAGRDPTRRPR
ncbi:AAA family ATPase [Geodermatophilus ruber]|uniref:AAA domain-containing protein n=1 Tax=Geodermatophilus ruber TaxID=504800 RepID=A0A1I4IMZ6_9ACTN|nr:ATP-binding protein [Geodermatophilus ruber]SFL55710.1 AAA domain-containing protein [Geodermatophilus ruber]